MAGGTSIDVNKRRSTTIQRTLYASTSVAHHRLEIEKFRACCRVYRVLLEEEGCALSDVPVPAFAREGESRTIS